MQIFILLASTNTAEAMSCDLGRIACIASCQLQKCASGYCTNVERGVCVCTRCGVP